MTTLFKSFFVFRGAACFHFTAPLGEKKNPRVLDFITLFTDERVGVNFIAQWGFFIFPFDFFELD